VSLLLWATSNVQARLLADEPAARDIKAASAVSPLLQYQGRLSDPGTGAAVADGAYSMTFGLYDVASGGSPLWAETKDVDVQGGLFSTALGDTTTLDTSLFDGRALWLGIKVGADAEATPRQQILPVAYALSLVPGATLATSSNEPVLNVVQSGAGAGGYFTSTTTYGIDGRTAATTPGKAGVQGVAGNNTSFFPSQESGVLGRASDGIGVAGMSDSYIGVYGYSTDYYPGVFYRGDGTAIYAVGGVTVTGDLEVGGNLISSGGTSLPVAYGVVDSTGSLYSGSSNVSSVWNATYSRYEITISGHSYTWNNYVTTVTIFTGCSQAYAPRTSSVSGKLLVVIIDGGGTGVQCDFQFVTYKP